MPPGGRGLPVPLLRAVAALDGGGGGTGSPESQAAWASAGEVGAAGKAAGVWAGGKGETGSAVVGVDEPAAGRNGSATGACAVGAANAFCAGRAGRSAGRSPGDAAGWTDGGTWATG